MSVEDIVTIVFTAMVWIGKICSTSYHNFPAGSKEEAQLERSSQADPVTHKS